MPQVPVKFIRTTASKVNSIAVSDGQYILVSSDSSGDSEYIAYDDSISRHIVSDVVDLPYDVDRNTVTPSARKFYYVQETNRLWRYIGNTWTCLNEPPGYVVQVDSKLQLPASGNVNTVYFVKDTNETYRWDATDSGYYCVGSDWHNINVINTNFN